MNKLLISTLVFIFSSSIVFGDVQAPAASHNIQILVEMRQAAFQDEAGTRSASRSRQTQFIVVTEGVEGKIFLGEKVPYAAYYQNFLTREGYLTSQAAIRFQDVGTSLIVRARVAGSRIEVTLTPEISYRTQDGRGSIAVQKMSTSVLVPEGQPLEIGGNSTNSEFESNFYRAQSGQALRIVLTPKILS